MRLLPELSLCDSFPPACQPVYGAGQKKLSTVCSYYIISNLSSCTFFFINKFSKSSTIVNNTQYNTQYNLQTLCDKHHVLLPLA